MPPFDLISSPNQKLMGVIERARPPRLLVQSYTDAAACCISKLQKLSDCLLPPSLPPPFTEGLLTAHISPVMTLASYYYTGKMGSQKWQSFRHQILSLKGLCSKIQKHWAYLGIYKNFCIISSEAEFWLFFTKKY